MNLIKIKCAFCGREYFREIGRVNEAKKFGWNQYCSKECQRRAKFKRVEKPCGNPNCKKLVSRTLKDFRKSKSGLIFCSRSCAATVNNKKHPKRHLEPKFKICIKCGKQFLKRKGYFKYCSPECKNKVRPRYTPQKLIEIIRRKVQELGRVPTRRELENIDNACRKFFGSWNNAVIAAGFQPNRSHNQRMYKCLKIKACDGHLCNSISESIIDDWLSENKIHHEKDIPYPETHHKTDWAIFINNRKIFIEYFGLANDSPRYDRTIEEKKKLCHKYKIELIEIYHWDLYPKRQFEKKIKRKLKDLNNILISQAGGTCTLDLRSPSAAP